MIKTLNLFLVAFVVFFSFVGLLSFTIRISLNRIELIGVVILGFFLKKSNSSNFSDEEKGGSLKTGLYVLLVEEIIFVTVIKSREN